MDSGDYGIIAYAIIGLVFAVPMLFAQTGLAEGPYGYQQSRHDESGLWFWATIAWPIGVPIVVGRLIKRALRQEYPFGPYIPGTKLRNDNLDNHHCRDC